MDGWMDEWTDGWNNDNDNIITVPEWIKHPDEKGKGLPIYSCHVQPHPVTGTRNNLTLQSFRCRLATGGQDGKIRLWNTAPILDSVIERDPTVTKLIATLSLHTGAVLCVRWSNINGKRLASGSDDSKIVIWEHDSASGPVGPAFGESGAVNIESWRAVKVLFGHESDVAHLEWSPENNLLASCGFDCFVFIWDGNTFDKIRKLDAHNGFVKGLTWDPVGKFLATQSDDGTVKIWRISDWVSEREIKEPYGSVNPTFFRRLSWSPDGSCIATANGVNGNIPVSPIINRDDWSTQMSLVGHQGPIEAAAFNPITFEIQSCSSSTSTMTAVCAVGSQDCGVSVWGTSEAYSVGTTKNLFLRSVLDLSWSSDGFILYSCSEDGTVAALTFDVKELGTPIPAKERLQKMEKYGYKAKCQPIIEFESQLRLEKSFAAKQDLGIQSTSIVALAAAPTITRSFNINQTETRTVDGRKRIQPVLIRSLNGESGVTSSITTRSDGIPSATLHIPPSKHQIEETRFMSSSKRQMLKADDKNLEYVLPTLVTATKAPKLLAVPKFQEKVFLSIGSLSIECRNLHFTGQEKSTVVGLKGGEIQFSITLGHAVLHAKGSNKFFGISCADCSLHVFTLGGRRLIPSIVLSSPCTILDIHGQFLMVVLAAYEVRIWNIISKSCTLHERIDIPSLFPYDEKSKNNTSLLSASLTSEGLPILRTTGLLSFTFNTNLKSWINITDFESIMSPKSGSEMCYSVPDSLSLPDVPLLAKRADILEHIENGMACALLMQSSNEYHKWLLQYARKLADEGASSKAVELCDELSAPASIFGDDPAQHHVLGWKKSQLLKEVIAIMGANRSLQRITASYYNQ